MMIRSRLACGLAALIVVSGSTSAIAATPHGAVASLNAQRALHGIPAVVTVSNQLSTGCDAHNVYQSLNGLGHGEIPGKPGWTAEGSMTAPGSLASEVLSSTVGAWDGSWANPWGDAPLHLVSMFDPAVTAAGYSEARGLSCMRFLNGGSVAPGVYSLPGPEVSGVPTTTDASTELPYSPADIVGVPERTGYNILIWRVGGHTDFSSVRMTGASGAIDARPIDAWTMMPDGSRWGGGGSLIVPTAPLAHATRYTVDIVFSDGLAHSFSFQTESAPDQDDDGVPDAVDRCGSLPGPPARGGCPLTRTGTRGGDVLSGTSLGDVLNGLGGNDVLKGFGGEDTLNGHSGRDRLDGHAGSDRLNGGGGGDRLVGGPGKDTFEAGPGNDYVDARDGVKELVRCGAGRDTVRADSNDRLVACEVAD